MSFGSTCRFWAGAPAPACPPPWADVFVTATANTQTNIKPAAKDDRIMLPPELARRHPRPMLANCKSETGSSALGQLRNFRRRGDHPHELAPLQQLLALASPPSDLVLGRTDRLFGASSCFHRHQIPVAA